MPQIPLAQRERILPGGSELPGPDFTRVQIAGTTGRGIADIGAVFADIGLKAQNANDNAELETETININKAWETKKLELDKIQSPDQYKIEASKSLKDIINKHGKVVNFRNKKRFNNVLSSIEASESINIEKNFFKKTVDFSKAALQTSELNLEEQILSGAISLSEGIDINAKLNNDRLSNGILNNQEVVNNISRFNDNISWQLFLKDNQSQPEITSEMTTDELKKNYKMTESMVVKAKEKADKSGRMEVQALKGKIDDHINSIISTGVSVIDIKKAERWLDKDEFNSLKISGELAFKAFGASSAIPDSTPSELENILKKFEPVGGSPNFTEQQKVFYGLLSTVNTELKEREKDPALNAARNFDATEMSVEDFDTRLLSVQADKGILEFNRRITSDKQVEDLKGRYLNANTTEKINMRLEIENQHGKHAQRFIGELMEKDFDNVFNIIGGMDNILATRDFIDAQDKDGIIETRKILGNNVKTIETEVLDIFNSTFGDTLPLNETGKDEYRIPVQNLALFYARRGDSNPAVKAMNEVYNNNNRYVGTIRIPNGINVDDKKLDAFLGNLRKGEIIDLKRIAKDRSEGEFPEDLFAADFYVNAEFFTNETEDGIVIYKDRVQMLEDVNRQGRRFEIKFEDINKADVKFQDEEDLQFTRNLLGQP